MNSSESYIQGFMDACRERGLSKQASLTMTKMAQTSNWNLLMRFLGGMEAGGRLAGRTAINTATLPVRIMQGSSRWLNAHPWARNTVDFIERLPGNTMRQWGRLAARHPIIGATLAITPAAYLINKHNNSNNDMMDMPTMTPSQQRMYDRAFHGAGYSGLGLDASDVSNFSYI